MQHLICKGLIGSVLKDAHGDCSLGGISSRCRDVTIVGLGPDAEIFEVTDDRPAVRIVRRELADGPYLHVEPVEPGQWAFGGAVVHSSDARWRKATQYPLCLHDRDLNKEGK
jgi:hypothetical protein